MVVGLLACGESMDSAVLLPPVRDGAAEPSVEPTAFADSHEASWVFDPAEVRTYELDLDGAVWEASKAHALDEQYTAADLQIAGQSVGTVGVRFKGDSTLRRCADRHGLRCPKVSMKLKFDEYDPDRRFYGLKRLNFNAMQGDASYLHERLAYHLFREMGVQAPRAVHARLVVNGEPLGLFTLVEAVDGRFTDDRFDDGNGNLYKEQWLDVGDAARMTQRLETNEEQPDHTGLLAFRAALLAALPEELPEVLERHLDVDQSLSQLAVDRAINNWDGPTSFYCKSGRCWNHNYYLYGHEDQIHFRLVPWDLNSTFAVSASLDYVPSWRVIPSDCSLKYPAFSGLTVMAPGCDLLLQGLARMDPARYQQQVTRLLEGPFALPALEAWLAAAVEQLEPFVAEDSNGPGTLAFRTELAALRHALPLLAMRMRSEQEAPTVALSRIETELPNDFEAATPVGVSLGILGRSSAESNFAVTLGKGPALGGERDAQLTFVLREGEQDAPRVRFALPFNSPDPIDLSSKSTLSLTLQSDAPRTFRFSLDSGGYSQYMSADTFGWDVSTDGSRQTVELPIDGARLPEGTTLPDTLSTILASGTGILIDPAFLGTHDAPDATDRGWI